MYLCWPPTASRARKIWSPHTPPVVKVLVVTITLLFVFAVYGTAHFYRDPGSIFFDVDRAYERQYSILREKEALEFLGSANKDDTKLKASKDWWTDIAVVPRKYQSPICAVVMTFGNKRGERQHPLELTISSLLAGLTPYEQHDLDLRIYIANSDPPSHPLYNSSLLSLAHSVVSAKDIATPSLLQKLQHLERNLAYIEKTAYDFSLALEHCYLNSTAPYIALFEDDILVAEGWFARMQLALREVNIISSKRQQGWLDLRLFNDAKEIRWTAHKFGRSNIPILFVALPFLISTISGIAYILLKLLRRTSLGSRFLSEQALFAICLFSIPLLIVIFFKAGHLSMISRPDGVSVQAWGCCTQGEIFPRSRIPGLITQLRRRAKTSPADITVWDHASDEHLLRLVLDPPMVQHIGFASVLAPKRKKRKSVWSIAFEDLDGTKLAQEHKRMVQDLYELE